MTSRRPAARILAWATAIAIAITGAYRALMSPTSQWLGAFPFRGSPAVRAVALTFDDGPNEPFTSQIGDYLAGQGIRATFFQVGSCVERFPAVSRRLLEQGHELGNHSYSHSVLRCLTPGWQRTETLHTQEVLTRVTGLTPTLYRPPWLLRTPSLLTILAESGLRPVSGSFCHPWEVFQPSARRIARRVLATARPGSILIFHDGFDARGGNRGQTAAAVPLVVTALQARGFTFVPVSELLHSGA